METNTPEGKPFFCEDKERNIALIRLFLYVTFPQLQEIAKSKCIKISCPWRTNDVTEGVFIGEREQREELKEYGYVCFSATPYSPSMWGYYADRSRGACLMFDFPLARIDNKGYLLLLNDWTTSESYEDRILRAVSYKRYREGKRGSIFSALYSKSREWSHEQEYRLLVRLSKIYADDLQDQDSLKNFYLHDLLLYFRGIILGAKCNFQVEEFRHQYSSFIERRFLTRAQISDKVYDMSINFSKSPPLSLPTGRDQEFLEKKWKRMNETSPICSSDEAYCIYKEGASFSLIRRANSNIRIFNVAQKTLAQIYEDTCRSKAPSETP